MTPTETIYPASINPSSHPVGVPLRREIVLAMLPAALAAGEYRFAREAALQWLAAFPGDLQASLFYAQALALGHHADVALPVLEGLCQSDPECLEAQELLSATRYLVGMPPAPETLSNIAALGGQLDYQETIASWGRLLGVARGLLRDGQVEKAENSVRQILALDPPSPLPAITHLAILEKSSGMPLLAKVSLAQYYHHRWPSCIACTLYLADWLMDGGESTQAVALLHQAAARDIGGRVASRLWGEAHPYRAIWPDLLEARLKIVIPAPVAAALGWNRLQSGQNPTLPAQESDAHPGNRNESELNQSNAFGASPASVAISTSGPSILAQPNDAAGRATPGTTSSVVSQREAANGSAPEAKQRLHRILGGPDSLKSETKPQATPIPAIEAAQKSESTPAPSPTPILDNPDVEMLRDVRAELERVAGRLNQAGLTRMEGRFPVYVVFSIRSSLLSLYGPDGTARLEYEMKRLVEAVGARPGWNARLFFADDPACTSTLGIRPAKPGDAWELKLALADLDSWLAKSGEMIGAVLIVGGPEIVPFHCLPNPVDDDDEDIDSDNPYATRDENYFIPEWPVGRLPGGSGSNPDLLLGALDRMTKAHLAQARRQAWHRRLWAQLVARLRWNGSAGRHSFGYTASIWRKASVTVYRPIGEPRTLWVSPPFGTQDGPPVTGKSFPGSKGLTSSTTSSGGRALKSPPSPAALLGYFNLHGLQDAAEWYGQRDPLEDPDGPDYPIALRPQDIGDRASQKERVPQVVFSEACYGAHIRQKGVQEAMALKFLACGSLAFAGSTRMAYGSVSTPLIAADLLGHAFWNYLRGGLPAGEALRRAKIQLAREMHDRQGYLDGEDQKTLISFILYGDPLAQPMKPERASKSVARTMKPPANVKTVCDRAADQASAHSIPPEVLSYVKHVVEQYLPGMEDADLTFAVERAECHTSGHICPTMHMKTPLPSQPPQRNLVTLSKQILRSDHIHPKVARLTLDSQGKLVKLVVSR